jgi:tetratricopeptide (TPR) repeat protein
MKVNIILFLSIVGLTTKSAALCLTKDSLEVQEKLALFQDAAKAKRYREAASHLHWLLGHKPKQHVSIYILGADVLDELAKLEKDQGYKRTVIDSMLLVYDIRLKYCGDSANVINRKALASYRYNINGPHPGKVLELMDEAFRLNQTEILDATLVPYMQAIALTKVKEKTLTQEDILVRYDKLMNILDIKSKLAESDKKGINKLTEYREEIDKLLLKIVKIDCDFIHTNLAPKYQRNPADLTMAKKIFAYMLSADCEKDSLWLRTGEFIFSKEPDFGLGKHLGLQYIFSQNIEKARYYMDASLKFAPTASDSADIYVFRGSLDLRQNNRLAARAAFREAFQIDPKHTEALEKIGDLYYNSFAECAKEISAADDRLTYLIAYDYYERSGNREKMEMTKKLFPSREEIFLMNYRVGEVKSVGCWINESTAIRTRD